MSGTFGYFSQDPTVRAIVQDGYLERQFHDALFPKLLFRNEATPELFTGVMGSTKTSTGTGLMTVKTKPLSPGVDPPPNSYPLEQWTSLPKQWGDRAPDVHMPTNAAAISSLLMLGVQKLGDNAGQTLNRIPRDKLLNAGLSGSTFCEATLGATGGNQTLGGGTSKAALRVRALNGFTRARRPDLANGSPVSFDPVSSNNPLVAVITCTVGTKTVNIVGFTPDNVGDEVGPGTLSLTFLVGDKTITDRFAIVASDATQMVRVGGGTIDDVGAGDIFDMATARTATAALRTNNVSPFGDGQYRAHIDPTVESQLGSDTAFQRLLTSLPDSDYMKNLSIGKALGTMWIQDNECPQPVNVAKSGGFFTMDEQVAVELVNINSIPLHHTVILGQDSLQEDYMAMSDVLQQEAGFTGIVKDFSSINENGVVVQVNGVKYIMRAPINVMQDMVTQAWSLIADWVCRTDAAAGTAARYKRVLLIQSGS